MSANGWSPSPPPPDWLDGPSGDAAPPAVRAVYDDIAAHLRVPFLGPFWRSLAWDPALFEALWAALGPLLATRAFEAEAAAVRRAALIVEAATMPSHQAFKADLVRAEIDYEMRMRIGNFNAAVCYSLAKTLLAATWLLLPPGAAPAGPLPGGGIPLGVAAGAVAVSPLPPEQRRGRAAELLDEIPRAHGHPLPDEYFLALARIPDFLNAAWNAIRPIVRDEPYDDRARELTRLAAAALARLPAGPAALRQRLDGHADAPRLRAVLRYFYERHLPDVLIDAAMIKALTEGPENALDSPFDLP